MRLLVPPGVFRPISDTWLLARSARSLAPGARVLDLCTGSGAVAIDLARHGAAEVVAIDVSRRAVLAARVNAGLNGARVDVRRGDLVAPVANARFDLVVSNPPYLCPQDIERAAPDVRDYEPRMATVAGASGLEVHRRLAVESPRWLRRGGMLVVETFEQQWPRLRPLLEAEFHDVAISPDLTGRLRVAEGRRP